MRWNRSMPRLLAVVLLAWACALPSAARADAPPVAVFTRLDGLVELRVGKTAWAEGHLLSPLPEGASVRLGKGAQATLSYVRGGLRVHLAGPCVITVGAQGVVPPSAAVRTTRHARQGTALVPAGVNIDQMGGARDRAQVALHVGDAMESDPDIEWRTTDSFAEYELALSTADGRRLWKTVVKGDAPTRLQATAGSPEQVFSTRLPEAVRAELKPGASYELRLTASRAVGALGATWAGRFRIIDAPVAQQIAEARKEAEAEFAAHPEDPTPMLVLVEMLLAQDLRFSAYHVVERLDARNRQIQDLRRRLRNTLSLPELAPR